MHVFSKPVKEDGVADQVFCSNFRCNIFKNFVLMQCCAHCLDIYCSVTCCENDENHKISCLGLTKTQKRGFVDISRRLKRERRIQDRIE
jgi:hypothetical protein